METEWHEISELIDTIRVAERKEKRNFEREFPLNQEKQEIRDNWQRLLLIYEANIVLLAKDQAVELDEYGTQDDSTKQQVLVKNTHLKLTEIAWSSLIDLSSLALAIFALSMGDLFSGVTSSALSISDLLRNIYGACSRLSEEQQRIYKTVIKLEEKKRRKCRKPPYPTIEEVLLALRNRNRNRDTQAEREQFLKEELMHMLGDSLVMREGGRISVY